MARARSNMAMRYDGVEFDTVEELLEYKRRKGGASAVASAPSSRSSAPRQLSLDEQMARDPLRGDCLYTTPTGRTPDWVQIVRDAADYHERVTGQKINLRHHPEFQAAAKAKKNRSVVMRRHHAKHNSPMKYDGIEFDTVEELLAYRAAQGKASASAPRQTRAASSRSGGGSSKSEASMVGVPVSYKQGRTIGFSVGGMESYCPSAARAMADGKSHAAVLNEMGLDMARASAAIDQMVAAGVAAFHLGDRARMTDADRKKALNILITVGKIVCKV